MERVSKKVYSDLIVLVKQQYTSEQTNAFRLISLAVIILAFSTGELSQRLIILSGSVALWLLVLSIFILIYCTCRWYKFYYLIRYNVVPEELAEYRRSEYFAIFLVFSVPIVCIIFGVLSLIFRLT